MPTETEQITSLKAEIERYRSRLQRLYVTGEHYRAIVDSSDDAIVSKDLEGIVTSWNKGAERIFGYTAQEMVGQPVRKLIPPEHQAEEDIILATLRRGERVDHFETVRLHKDGSRLNISVTVSPIKNAAGVVVGASKVARDITLRHRASDLRNRLSAIVESSDDAIIGKDLVGTITSWNKGAEHIFGYTAKEIIGRSINVLVPEANRGEELDILRRLRHGERIDHFITERLRKDGSVVQLSLTISPIHNEKGEVVGASKVARDITGQRRANARLKENEEKFNTIFREAPIGIVLIEMATGRLQDANPAFEALTGAQLEDLRGRTATEVGFEMEDADLNVLLASLARHQQVNAMEMRLRDRHGRVLYVLVNATVMSIGAELFVLLHVEDITVRKESEAALRETDRRKDEFLATLAHELRNPLAPLSNALQLLELVPDDKAMTAHARGMMGRQLQQLVHLVDDLMDLSRVNRGVIELQRRPMDLRSAMVQAVEAVRPLIERRGHTLKVVQADKPLWVNGDNTRLVQVFTNLLNNAAKYTDDGGCITVTTAARGGVGIAEVQDTGTGIEPQQAKKVFDMFAQLENSTTRKQGGLGIGLSIVKKLVVLHGGDIGVESPGQDQGSTFSVRLPIGPPPPEGSDERQRTEDPTVRLRVLVTDDNVEAAKSLCVLLRTMGHEARAVHNGHDCVVEVPGFKPHVIFLDIGMPGMDGYETCRCIRATPAGAHAHIVALTGWGQDEDRRLAAEAGFDEHVVKPIGRDDLRNILTSSAALKLADR